MTQNAPTARVLLVSGVSGAGKSSALKLLEDMGYEAVDNMPLSLVARLVLGGDGGDASQLSTRPIAVGIDIRTRDFDAALFLDLMDQLEGTPGLDAKLLFVDCSDVIIGRRFEETRRRHPLAADRPIADGLQRERRIMAPVRARADVIIDTTDSTTGDLKMRLAQEFQLESDPGLAIFVMSFSFRRGVPRDADLMFDVRFLRNPHYDPVLRPKTGRDTDVQDYVMADTAYEDFFSHLTEMTEPLLPRYREEGKSYLTIAFGCTGGRHRSVTVAETFRAWLEDKGWPAHIRHRDLDKA